MEENSSILVAGGRGMVGSAICRALANEGYENVLAPARAELDLLDQHAVDDWLSKHRPNRWGHARDYVEAQWLMLQQDEPDDYVIATGKQRSVRDFVNAAAAQLGVEIEWRGKGDEEHGIVASASEESYAKPGHCIVTVDPRYFRPAEVETLLGDAEKARKNLGWQPQITFSELVAEMVENDLARAHRDALIEKHGYQSYKFRE